MLARLVERRTVARALYESTWQFDCEGPAIQARPTPRMRADTSTATVIAAVKRRRDHARAELSGHPRIALGHARQHPRGIRHARVPRPSGLCPTRSLAAKGPRLSRLDDPAPSRRARGSLHVRSAGRRGTAVAVGSSVRARQNRRLTSHPFGSASREGRSPGLLLGSTWRRTMSSRPDANERQISGRRFKKQPSPSLPLLYEPSAMCRNRTGPVARRPRKRGDRR